MARREPRFNPNDRRNLAKAKLPRSVLLKKLWK